MKHLISFIRLVIRIKEKVSSWMLEVKRLRVARPAKRSAA
jgi:hypothetical protein